MTMTQHFTPGHHDGVDERPSGVPPKGRLGASRNEMLALLVGLGVVIVIVVAFWLTAH